jgi:hypothetical protein
MKDERKRCAKCGLPFDCAVSPDCWCKGVAAWRDVRASAQEKYKDCLCPTCFSLSFYHPSTLRNVWGIR